MMTGDELTSHLNVWHESALAKGEAGLPHGMSPAVASAYEAYHRHLHAKPLDHRHDVKGIVYTYFTAHLYCGHGVRINGSSPVGSYISCPGCQRQQKVLAVEDQA
jgi:hypothetical protein